MQERHIEVNNQKVRYYESGDPNFRTLVLLHGSFGDARANWQNAANLLTDEYHILALDLPGYGQSDALSNTSFDDYVEWLHLVFDALHIEQAAVIGHAFGALLARLFAAKHLRYVPAMVFVDGGVIPNVPVFGQFLARLPVVYNRLAKSSSSRSSMEKAVHSKTAVSDSFYESVQNNVGGLTHVMMTMALSKAPTTRTPRVPVLILWGEQDNVSPIDAGKSMHNNIPGSIFMPIAQCGHLPHVEAPDVFAWQVKNFFNDLNRARSQSG